MANKFLAAAIIYFSFVPFFLVLGQNVEDLTQAMATRSIQILLLRSQGHVEEGSNGYLDATSSASGRDKKLIDEQNADRRALYQATAQQVGLTIDEVAKHAASRIQANVRAGRLPTTPKPKKLPPILNYDSPESELEALMVPLLEVENGMLRQP